tara:strand:+ start:473 stop:1393 length:921 start_codon:yes stop_codon:yes gene_type:complete
MYYFLPIAEVDINLMVILFCGFFVGFLSGLFGVGGGFLMTPILIFLGIPPGTAVATEANQILGSSVSGAIAHNRKKNIDFEIGYFLLIGGIFGSTLGVVFFKFMRDAGNLDLTISLLYIVFLAVIGSLMFVESTLAIFKKKNSSFKIRKSKRNFLDALPLKYKFRRSRKYISILVPVFIGYFVGILSALMGVGGGFIMVPAMIYILGMSTVTAIGTSLFQIVFVTTNVTILQATYNQSVDLILAVFLLIGGVIGAQFGSRYTSKFKGEHLRILLASVVILVCFKMSFDLVTEPLFSSRIILQDRLQ